MYAYMATCNLQSNNLLTTAFDRELSKLIKNWRRGEGDKACLPKVSPGESMVCIKPQSLDKSMLLQGLGLY
jgi:hypothetical protein